MPAGAITQPLILPATRAEMNALGWDHLDVLLVTGDAYVDHPSFGAALLGRWLVAHGYRTGIVAQPRWDIPGDVARMGRPRLFAGVTAGALDSMLAHYTAFRKKRSDDAYTPGGRAGKRPNRASIVYTGLVRQAFPGLPVVLGGIEASLRRATHFDFWTGRVRRSILLDSKADLLLYGMAERAIIEVAERVAAAAAAKAGAGIGAAEAGISGIAGSVFVGGAGAIPAGAPVVALPSHEEIEAEPRRLMDATLALERQVHAEDGWALQASSGRTLIMAPPAPPMTAASLDALYDLPFSFAPHPSYAEPVPALEPVLFSVTTHRGCGGGCSFCSLALHQGRRIRSRSAASIRREVGRFRGDPRWRGCVSDVGGPSANMWGARCTRRTGPCRRASCLFPQICPNFRDSQKRYAALLQSIEALPGVKQVRVASGVRHDLGLRDLESMRALVARFVGGQLKLAPEHVSDAVLDLMRKPGLGVFQEFLSVFEEESRRAGRQQYVVPYLMSAFPGCTNADMRALADWLRRRGWKPRQVQCFIPIPGTVAAAMFHAGIDPSGDPIYVARTDAERLGQHRILMPVEGGSKRRPDDAKRPRGKRRR